MRVIDNLHIIKTPYFNRYTASYLIEGPSLTLIDCGERESWDQDIKPYIESLGRKPDDLDLVVITHNHDDHMGSARQIREETGAAIAASAATAGFLARHASVWEWEERSFEGWLSKEEVEHILDGTDYGGTPRKRRPPVEVDRVLADRDLIDAGPFRLTVIEAPGHTVDSIAVHEPTMRLLFTGDTVNGEGSSINGLPVYQCLPELDRTLSRLAGLKPDILLMGHPYLPFVDAVLRGNDAQAMFEITRRTSARFPEFILDALRSEGRSMSTAEISEVVHGRLRSPNGPTVSSPSMTRDGVPRRQARPPETWSHGSVRLNLVCLLNSGAVRAERAADEIRWAIAEQPI